MEEMALALLEEAAMEGHEIARLLWNKRYGGQLFRFDGAGNAALLQSGFRADNRTE
jgi:hypothetical protein